MVVAIMYEKLSKRVESVVKLARSIASNDDQEYLGTEHILLAIAGDGAGLGFRILKDNGVDEHKLGAEIKRLSRKSLEETWVFGSLPGSPHLKAVVATAIDVAQQLGAREVCTEHLLLAMLAEEGSVAGQALRNLGVTDNIIRSSISENAPNT